MEPAGLVLTQLPEAYTICRLFADAPVPSWALSGNFYSVTRTSDELSIVCAESVVPEEVTRSGSWCAFRVAGPLDFALTGILAGLASTLAAAGIPLFAVSTYDTDYLLVRAADQEAARAAFLRAGYRVE